jgi:hypothetical protein
MRLAEGRHTFSWGDSEPARKGRLAGVLGLGVGEGWNRLYHERGAAFPPLFGSQPCPFALRTVGSLAAPSPSRCLRRDEVGEGRHTFILGGTRAGSVGDRPRTFFAFTAGVEEDWALLGGGQPFLRPSHRASRVDHLNQHDWPSCYLEPGSPFCGPTRLQTQPRPSPGYPPR